MKQTFPKYQRNLHREGDRIYSYDTHVATIQFPGTLIQHGWWSMTTQKHINYVAESLGLTLDRNGH